MMPSTAIVAQRYFSNQWLILCLCKTLNSAVTANKLSQIRVGASLSCHVNANAKALTIAQRQPKKCRIDMIMMITKNKSSNVHCSIHVLGRLSAPVTARTCQPGGKCN